MESNVLVWMPFFHGAIYLSLCCLLDLDPTELPPLDEKGLPKYKGKKRGRKPKEKKRKMNPDRPKRKHTGYTLFMQEMYPSAKSECPDLPSKDLISLVAKRWKDLGTDGKTAWKDRAQQASDETRETTSTNSSEEQIDTEASFVETGAASNSHLEGNGDEEDDEGIPNDLTED